MLSDLLADSDMSTLVLSHDLGVRGYGVNHLARLLSEHLLLLRVVLQRLIHHLVGRLVLELPLLIS